MSDIASRLAQLGPEKLAVFVQRMQSEIKEFERAKSEPIAIIGMGCRFPGAATPEDFWRLMDRGMEAIGEVPPDRWDADAFYDADPEAQGKMYTRWAHFVEEVDAFDPLFFGISPREAQSLDPQQRLLLEVSWEALEDAGQAADRIKDASVGVFVGIMNYDYQQIQAMLGGVERIDVHTGTGCHWLSVAAGRISYVLGVQGPALSVDTACSSSLVTVHLACVALRRRECDMALAGGVNLMLFPEPVIVECKARMLAPDGRSKTFDVSANGFGRGEGCGMVVLKRLSDALTNGDNILALVRGSAVNHDGASSGLTVPNSLSQQQVIRRALRDAGVEASQVGYVEAHGTGTALGDPIEMQSLGAVYGRQRPEDGRLAVGSVKTNVGHLESGAGIAGIVKVVLALQHEKTPPHLNLREINPYISLDETNVVVPTAPTPWGRSDSPRIAAISSFGASGTNSHVIVEEAPTRLLAQPEVERPLHLLCLSAKDEHALEDVANRYELHLGGRFPGSLPDICYTANVGRSHFERRRVVVATSIEEARSKLSARRDERLSGQAIEQSEVAFLFPGQGAEYVGMGRGLYESQPTFRKAVDRCAEVLSARLDVPLAEILVGHEGRSPLMDDSRYGYPALFAIEYALSALWRAWGVEPSVVLGHGVGEYVAGCVAGTFSLEDGLMLVAERGRLVSSLPEGGAMAAVEADEDRVAAAIRRAPGQVSIAAVHGRRSVVVSGAENAVGAVIEALEAEGVRTARLQVTRPVNSPLVEPILEELGRVASKVQHAPPRIDLISSLTGQSVGSDGLSASYWQRQVREPVWFSTAIAAAERAGCGIFVEMGPSPVLVGLGRRCLGDKGLWLPSLCKERDDWHQMLESLGRLYTAGVDVAWSSYDEDYSRRRVRLPTYPFQRRRYWLEGLKEFQGSQEADRDWFYGVEWRAMQGPEPSETPGETQGETQGTWLVFGDRSGVGNSLQQRLEERGERCLTVTVGRDFEALGAGRWVMDARCSEHYDRLLDEVRHPLRGVVHFWNLDVPPAQQTERDPLDDAMVLGCGSVLLLIQALVRAGQALPVWAVTAGAQHVVPEQRTVAVSQSPVWGLGQVIAQEHREVWGGLIDLDPEQPSSETAVRLVAEITQPAGEDHLAFRGGRRYVARLVPRRQPSGRGSMQLGAGATYLITGGLGGLGLEVARWMVDRGARHLVLMGRRGAQGDAIEKIHSLEERGAQIVVMRGDVSEADDTSRVLAEIGRLMPPLRGIVHAAGVLDDGVLLQQNLERFARVLAPKIVGTWNLHVLTQDTPLDFFVLFSSVASLLGSSGQANYAAANAFLDAMAHHRRAQGQRALSVNWGPWGDVGMAGALGGQEERRWLAKGIEFLAPAKGLDALEAAMLQESAQLGVLRVTWSKYLESVGGVSPAFLADLVERAEEHGATEDLELIRRLGEVRRDRRMELLDEHVRGLVGRLLGLDPSFPDSRKPLMELGMDSLVAVELKNALGRSVGRTLPATLAFDYPNIEAIVRFLDREVFGEQQVIQRVEERRPVDESVAIVGMGCRFPGGAVDIASFWRVLNQGIDVVTEVPRDRWNIDEYFDPDPDAPGKIYARKGCFLREVDTFDPLFFGISPRETEAMDPQQRLLLEVSWEALENAGLAPEKLSGSRTGVFVGITNNDYEKLQMKLCDPTRLDAYTTTGLPFAVAAGRVAYCLGLQGPAIAVDTACSSSLVALHLATRSLRSGECSCAIVGGVNLLLSPEMSIGLSRTRALATDGRCKTFDAGADGYGRGEGCGVVVIKRLSDALEHGDTILALLKGSAVNQDGRSSGLTAPNGPAQEAVMREALADAGVAPSMLGYLETHGTGTILGDPIELRALGSVFRDGRSSDRRLAVGSVKTVIGHLESAAGIAGVIKVVLAMQNNALPPHLNLEAVNPHIPLDDLPLTILPQQTPWATTNGPRVAGVSAFGFSGTNAHVVIEEFQSSQSLAVVAGQPERSCHLLALSARSNTSLKTMAERHGDHLESHPEFSLADVCYSANVGRSHFEHRLAVVAATAGEARGKLADFCGGHETSGVVAAQLEGGERPRIAFLFTGSGSQYRGMGRELYDTQPTFRRVIDRCEGVLAQHLDVPLLAILDDEKGTLLQRPGYSEPALFALEYALADLLRSWGVKPQAVMGYGVGEYVAACVAGVFSLEHGLGLVSARGRLLEQLLDGGAMAAVLADEATVAGVVAERSGVSVAAVHGPQQTVLCGPTAEVETVLEDLGRRGVPARRLGAGHAVHSLLVEPMLEALAAAARKVAYHPPDLGIISTTTGEMVETWTADHWRRHARGPVRFAAGMKAVRTAGCQVFLEVGPEPVLTRIGRSCLSDLPATWISSLEQGRGDWPAILTSLATLYAAGAAIDWTAFDGDYSRHRVVLPTYPFQRKRYWIRGLDQPGTTMRQAGALPGGPIHPLLGRHLVSSVLHVFESQLRPDSPPFMNDHIVHKTVVVSGPTLVDMAWEAGTRAFGRIRRLEEAIIQEPLILSRDAARTVQVVLTPGTSAEASFQIISRQDDRGEWSRHASGRILVGEPEPAPSLRQGNELPAVQGRCREEMTGEELYRILASIGLELGSSFQAVKKIWKGDREALSIIQLPDEVAAEAVHYQIHPTYFDSWFQMIGAVQPTEDSHGVPHVPYVVDRLQFYERPSDRMWCHFFLRKGSASDDETFTGDIRIFDETGRIVAEMIGLHLKRAPRESMLRRLRASRDWFYEIEWAPAAHTQLTSPGEQGTFLLFADSGEVGVAVAGMLAERGQSTRLVVPGETFGVTREGTFTINPSAGEDYDRVVQEMARTGISWRGVIHLWSLDGPPAEEMSARAIENASIMGYGSALHLMQAVARAGTPFPRLWFVTRGAQPIGKEEVAVHQSPLWGLGRVVRIEHPRMWGGLVDLGPGMGPGDAARALAAEVLGGDAEDQVAFRGAQRHVARLVRRRIKEQDPPSLAADGTYLITGGLGGLGLLFARWMVERGARHLVLLELRGPSEAAWDKIRDLEEKGARVVVAQGDISQEARVAEVLAEIGRTMPPLRGIVHTAGVSDFGMLLEQDWARFVRVFAPKASGAWNLHQLTRDTDLDFFVLFSSQASLLGSAGQSSYVAANIFLDALAHHRRALGRAALTVNWGPWSEVGMAATQDTLEVKQRWTGAGIGYLSPQHGLEAFEQVLGQDAAQVGVLQVRWDQLVQYFSVTGKQPLLSRLAPMDGSPEVRERTDTRPELVRQLEQASPVRRRRMLTAFIKNEVAKVLRFDSPDAVDPKRNLMELGVDSMMAVAMRNALRDAIGRSIPATMIFDHPTIESIAGYLSEEVFGASEPPRLQEQTVGEQVPPQETEIAEIEELSDEAAAALLAAELDGLSEE